MKRRRVPIETALLACLALACTGDELVVQSGIPGARASSEVRLVAERGELLDVNSETGGRETRFLVPNDDDCRHLFVGEQPVSYSNSGGRFGSFHAGDRSCEPVGVLSLVQWRDRRPRNQNASVIPRARAELRERIYRDDDVELIRGRFPLAAQIGITGAQDLIAVIPVTAECADLPVPGSLSMEFRQVGRQPFTLIHEGRRCTLQGFALAPPPA
jgi:hypothetical protein